MLKAGESGLLDENFMKRNDLYDNWVVGLITDKQFNKGLKVLKEERLMANTALKHAIAEIKISRTRKGNNPVKSAKILKKYNLCNGFVIPPDTQHHQCPDQAYVIITAKECYDYMGGNKTCKKCPNYKRIHQLGNVLGW